MYTEKELIELEQFFTSAKLPKQIQLNQSQKIVDVKRFYEGHIAFARANMGKSTFSSFYDRLVKLKELLQANK